MPVFKKGQKPGPGRPKGRQNKITASAKAALEEAFDGVGGVPSLIAWAQKEPSAFYAIWGKLVPKEVDLNTAGPLEVTVRVVREDRRRTAS